MKTRSQARAEKSPEDKESEVERLSKKLKEELSPKPSPFKFESVNSAKKGHLRQDLTKIVHTVFINDVHETWLRLRKQLVIGDDRSNHGILQKALDRAEKNAHDAHRLYVTARVEMERWERENEVIFSAMWSEATASLQDEKDRGLRNKAITDKDIRMRAAALHPDEWGEQETEREKVKAVVDSMENLADMWKSRCHTLNAMMSKLRG